MNQVLAAEGLTFGYDGLTILDNTGFSVREGDLVGIIGSNGAGKSTLLRLILGELTPAAGSVTIFGEPVERFRRWGWVGYVPQNGAVALSGFPATARELVTANLYSQIGPLRLPGNIHKWKAQQALARVGLEDQAGSPIGLLSGGQLQRVLLARALVGEPRLLLLDEPTTGIDATSAEVLYLLLKEQSMAGITVVMVTHDLHRSAEILDRAFCLEHGSIVALDRQQLDHEMSHRHQHP